MSRAVVIPFHRYHPHFGEYYRVWGHALCEGLEHWGKEFDKLYLIDDDWHFSFEEHDRLKKLNINYEIIRKQKDGHHWVQFHTAIPFIKEDFALFMDNDVLIWKPGVVDGWFKQAEAGKFVSAFDGSGGLEKQMHLAFPELPEGTHRMGSYYFILNKKQLKLAKETSLAPVKYAVISYIPELDYYTVKGDWQDSFGQLTIKILAGRPELYVIDDDRSSIYMEGQKFNKDPKTPKQLGYYHVRNGGHTTQLLSSKFGGDEESYRHSVEITPQRELLRLMAWHHIAGDGSDWLQIEEILRDIGVQPTLWLSYVEEFRKYHGL